MAKLFFVISVLLCLQLTSCRVFLDSTQQIPLQTTQQTLDFQELVKQAQFALVDLNLKFLNIVGVKDNDELVQVVQEQSQKYAVKVQGLVEQLKTQTSKADETVHQIAAKLGTAVDELKIKTETYPNLKKLQDAFLNSIHIVLKETEEFGTKLKVQSKDVYVDAEKVLKDIFDNSIEAVKKVAHEVDIVVQEKKT